ncbi:hypothetical protein KKA15_05935 [Patescibacteria group bacterium]|nr:hypothetical protein [Patescibacteria group bacterium]
MKKIISTTIIISILGISLPSFINASSIFDQNYIISDQELTDYESLSLVDIQNFLEAKQSTLANMSFPNFLGHTKSVAQIIYDASRENQISPKFIITMLQKEQSLIEGKNPTQRNYDWATGYALCDSCNSSDPDLAFFKGFGTQVHFLATIMRKYIRKSSEYNYQVGKTSEVDFYIVTPINQATANLYNYTPHISGNKNFWRIWQDYWDYTYPDGSLLQVVGDSDVWYIHHGIRKRIDSYSVLLSRFDVNKIITVASSDIEIYPKGPDIEFANYSLLRIPTGTVYLLVDDTLRHISSMEVFRTIGYNWDEVENVLESDLKSLEKGDPITMSSVYPTGALLQDNKTGGIFYVADGLKHPIYSKEIWLAKYRNKELTSVSPDELENYLTSSPVKFTDGELIKSMNEPAVYVISEGKRRPIISGDVFESLGYSWRNIIITSPNAVGIHPLGEVIE